MAVLYDNLQGGTLTDNPLASGGTTINSTALANLVAVTGSDVLYITLDPEGVNGAPEIVQVTAHTAAATSATVVRARQGTTARSHPLATVWIHAVTETDLQGFLTEVPDGSVTTAKIVDANVTTAKILDANVTAAKMASDSVATANIIDANVTTAKIADLAVTQGKLGTTLQTDTLFKADNKITWTAAPLFSGSATNLTVNYAKYQYVTANRVYGELDVSITGTPGSGSFTFTLPVATVDRPASGKQQIGWGILSNGSGSDYVVAVWASSNSTGGRASASSLYLSSDFTYLNPITLGANCYFNLKFEYPVS